ncbi:MAG: alanine racemase [Clostridia bacterium]|nr:alanine racemase [Clostridia bacterium]
MQEYNKLTDRTYVEIDVEALRHNIQIARDKVGDGVKIMCLVKANAYGHGAVAVTKYCQDLIDYLGVATVDEGIELRQSGVALPILIVGDIARSRYKDAIDYDIEVTAHSLECARWLNDFCKTVGKRIKTHIAVDTGMGRIGFLPEEVNQAVEVCRLGNLEIKGVFTHFSKADETDKSYTYMQKRLFDEFVERLKREGADVGLRHVANSASILDVENCNCDMVRMGVMTYGLSPLSAVKCQDLRPAMSWYSYIAHIKTLPKGHCISYGGDYITRDDTVVATVAVGYGDGYPRALSGKSCVLVKGEKAPVIGRICMDQMMIDITHIDGVKVGDKVTLMGKNANQVISAEELADLAGTINYEIVCSIAPRVPRVYVNTLL